MAGTPRWNMAVEDNDLRLPAMYRHFACSLGTSLTMESAPRLTRLLANVSRDTGRVSNNAKRVFQRQRPYQLWGADICVPRTASLDASPDYPSGHSTWGWTIALILAEIAPPDRSSMILARARAYGESRAVCGMHSLSAVEAGRTTAAVIVAAQHASTAFQADLAAARTELATALRRPRPRDEGECQAEINLVAQPAFRNAAGES
jgi:acid phosphatase (class A)